MKTNNQPERRSIRNLFSDLKLGGILYALLINIALATIAALAADGLQSPNLPSFVAIAGAITGILTVLYVGERGGTHAFLGGMISVPFIAFIAVDMNWSVALYAGIFCALAGLLFDRIRSRRR